MPEQPEQLTRRDLVSKLLDISNKFLIVGDPKNAWVCTQAAARILAIPQSDTEVQHLENVHPLNALVDEILNYKRGES